MRPHLQPTLQPLLQPLTEWDLVRRVGTQIHQVRRAKGLSPSGIARLVPCEPEWLTTLEAGALERPSLYRVYLLAVALADSLDTWTGLEAAAEATLGQEPTKRLLRFWARLAPLQQHRILGEAARLAGEVS